MRKKKVDELSEKDRAYIKAVYSNKDLSWDEREKILASNFNKSSRTIRRWISSLGYSEHKDVENEEIRQGKLRTHDPSKKYALITWAQNATPVHKPFFDNIKIYAEFLDAEIFVIQGRYSNPTSIFSENMENSEWWDPILVSYLDGSRHKLHENLTLLSDIKVVPTASDPLTSFEGTSGESSSIIGHPRVHAKFLPVLEGHNKKALYTTGSVTVKNYTDSKAGKRAEFHHVYGVILAEIESDSIVHIRQITAEQNGSFYDLWFHVDGEVKQINSCEAFIAGDIHVSQCEIPVMEKTIELFQTLRPNRFVVHDLFNGKSISHHELKDPIKLYQKHEQGLDILKNEVQGVYNFIDKYKLLDYNLLVVRSNHDEWIDRRVRDTDWRDNIPNAKELIEYTLATLSGDAPKGVLPYLLDKRYGNKITTLDFDDSFKVLGWEVAQHGHLGANGSKGSINAFRNLNTKLIVADSHTPGRKDGAIQVGTYSILRMGFNHGPSSWVHCGAIIHNNGKAQLIVFSEKATFTTLHAKLHAQTRNRAVQASTA